MNESVINRDPKVLGGTAVFRGTRVPIKAIFDYLEAGDSLDEFLDDFPSVAREQAVELLELARASSYQGGSPLPWVKLNTSSTT